jgi:hypothetical protein
MLVLIALMGLADVMWIASQGIQLEGLKHYGYNDIETRISSGVTVMIASICFSLSHWVFCFKYYTSSRRLTLLLNHQSPKTDDSKLHIINIVFLVLNTLIPALYAWSFTDQTKDNGDASLVLFYAASSSNLALQLVSLFVLSLALYSIKF